MSDESQTFGEWIDELERDLEKTLQLLRAREFGLSSWTERLQVRLGELHDKIGVSLGRAE
jgi:hypothetical protein